MSQEEYLNDLRIRSAELEYKYWTIKLEIVEKEKEMHDKLFYGKIYTHEVNTDKIEKR